MKTLRAVVYALTFLIPTAGAVAMRWPNQHPIVIGLLTLTIVWGGVVWLLGVLLLIGEAL